MSIGIYLIRNKINNKIYVGQSVNIKQRLARHKSELSKNRHDNKHLQKSYNKYGKENFEFKIIELCNEDELDIKEVYWIEQFDSMNYLKGYNQESGGNKNKRFSEERIKKITGAGNPMYNKKHTDEVKETIRIKNRGVNSKLTVKEVSEIKNRLYNGERCIDLSNEYNVDITTISKIFTCKNWSWVNSELNEKLINYKKIKDSEIEVKANKMFDEGKTINQISDILKVDKRKISRIVKNKLRAKQGNSKLKKIEKAKRIEMNKKNKDFYKEKIIEMKSNGMLNKDIAKELNLHRTTITEYLKKYAPEYLKR